MPPNILAWEAPPERGLLPSRDNEWTPVAAQLRNNPNKWAYVLEVPMGSPQAAALSSRIKSGYGPWGPRGAFEAKTRTTGIIHVEPRTVRVYVRFLADEVVEETDTTDEDLLPLL